MAESSLYPLLEGQSRSWWEEGVVPPPLALRAGAKCEASATSGGCLLTWLFQAKPELPLVLDSEGQDLFPKPGIPFLRQAWAVSTRHQSTGQMEVSTQWLEKKQGATYV